MKSKPKPKQNAGSVELSIGRIEKIFDKVHKIRLQTFREGKLNYEAMLYEVEMDLCKICDIDMITLS